MPTSAPRSERARGFTLIEILVTLVIMALLAGLAALSVGGNARRLASDEAERLRQVLALASEEATMQGEELGLLLGEGSYRLLRFDPETESWSEAPGRLFAEHELAAGVELDLRLDEAPRAAASRDGGEELPEVLLSSSGEITPFRLEVRLRGEAEAVATLESDGSGTIREE